MWINENFTPIYRFPRYTVYFSFAPKFHGKFIARNLLIPGSLLRDTNRQAAIDIMQGLEPDLAEIRDEVEEVR